MKPCVILIAAMDEQHGIGLNNKLPWNLPEDMLHFRITTLGYPIIMGRKTFESIGRALPQRQNLVVSRNLYWGHEMCFLRESVEEAIEDLESDVFVIGGAEIFKHALPLANKMIITHIHKVYECDTFFPEIDPDMWEPISSSGRLHSSSADVDYTIVTYASKSKEKQ